MCVLGGKNYKCSVNTSTSGTHGLLLRKVEKCERIFVFTPHTCLQWHKSWMEEEGKYLFTRTHSPVTQSVGWTDTQGPKWVVCLSAGIKPTVSSLPGRKAVQKLSDKRANTGILLLGTNLINRFKKFIVNYKFSSIKARSFSNSAWLPVVWIPS